MALVISLNYPLLQFLLPAILHNVRRVGRSHARDMYNVQGLLLQWRLHILVVRLLARLVGPTMRDAAALAGAQGRRLSLTALYAR